MWFKKQEKPARIRLYGADGSTFGCFASDVGGVTAQWLLGEVNKGRAAIAANQAAGDIIRKQAAEIGGLARELDERRAWETEAKDAYNEMEKELDESNGLLEQAAERIEGLLAENGELQWTAGMDDYTIRWLAKRLRGLEDEAKATKAEFDNTKVELASARGYIEHLEQELAAAKKRGCKCGKRKEGKAK